MWKDDEYDCKFYGQLENLNYLKTSKIWDKVAVDRDFLTKEDFEHINEEAMHALRRISLSFYGHTEPIDYQYEDVLGGGATATAFSYSIVNPPPGPTVPKHICVKYYALEDEDVDNLNVINTEIEIYKQLLDSDFCDDTIIPGYPLYSKHIQPVLLMPRMDGTGDKLRRYLHSLDIKDRLPIVVDICKQLLNAMICLRDMGLFNGDLTLPNMLYQCMDHRIKVYMSDLGASLDMEDPYVQEDFAIDYKRKLNDVIVMCILMIMLEMLFITKYSIEDDLGNAITNGRKSTKAYIFFMKLNDGIVSDGSDGSGSDGSYDTRSVDIRSGSVESDGSFDEMFKNSESHIKEYFSYPKLYQQAISVICSMYDKGVSSLFSCLEETFDRLRPFMSKRIEYIGR